MRINLHGYGTPTTMSRIRALLSYFAEDGFVLTRDPKQTFEDIRGRKPHTRGEPLLLSPSGQRAYIRDVEVLLTGYNVQYWDNEHKIWDNYPICK
jgi:hypothetical protein